MMTVRKRDRAALKHRAARPTVIVMSAAAPRRGRQSGATRAAPDRFVARATAAIPIAGVRPYPLWTIDNLLPAGSRR